MDKTFIYLVSGKSLNGKDTLYSLCREEVGWVRVAFADKLKEAVADLYGFSTEQMYGELKDVEDQRYPNSIDSAYILDPKEDVDWVNFALSKGATLDSYMIKNPIYKPFLTPRRVLQVFGQDQRRLFPHVWVNYVFNKTIPQLVCEGFRKFIVTDVRFKNEIKIAYQAASETTVMTRVRITRPGVCAKTGASDPSEVDLDDYADWDYVLVNDGSPEELKRKGLEMVRDVETPS